MHLFHRGGGLVTVQFVAAGLVGQMIVTYAPYSSGRGPGYCPSDPNGRYRMLDEKATSSVRVEFRLSPYRATGGMPLRRTNSRDLIRNSICSATACSGSALRADRHR